jgi:site-specific DNA recombinase
MYPEDSMPPSRAGIYTRISNDPLHLNLGVQRQEQDCKELCEKLGWTVIDVYQDSDISAYSGKIRPNYRRLLEDAESGVIDAIVSWHVDRLNRSPAELEEIIDICNQHNVAVQTVKAGPVDLSSPSGRAVARTLSAWARYESENKSDRQRRKAFELAQAGKLAGGGYRPYGFQQDRKTIKEDEAAVIREVAERIIAGESMGALIRDLNERSVPTSEGGRWTNTTMRRLLTSPRISGQRGYEPTTTKRTVYGGDPVAKAEWDEIITPEQTLRLRSILIDADRSQARMGSRRYLLTGILVCGNCGNRMCGRPRDDHEPRYVCNKKSGNDHCGKVFVLAKPTDEYVVGLMKIALDSPAFWAALNQQDDQPDGNDLRLLTGTQEKLTELARDWASGLLSRSEWLAAKEVLDTQQQALTARLSKTSPRFALSSLAGEDFDQAFELLSLSRKQAVLSAVFLDVEVRPAVRGRNFFDGSRLSPHWRV